MQRRLHQQPGEDIMYTAQCALGSSIQTFNNFGNENGSIHHASAIDIV